MFRQENGTMHAKGFKQGQRVTLSGSRHVIFLCLCLLSIAFAMPVFSAHTVTSHAECAGVKESQVFRQPIRVAFINPASAGEVFWDKVITSMQSKAKELAMTLTVHYAEGNRFKVLELVRQIVRSRPETDYLIFIFQAHLGAHLLKLTEAARLHSFAINTNVPEDEQEEIGLPRQNFRYWLGHMFPDEQHAGYQLAQSLYQQARSQTSLNNDFHLNMLAIAGSNDSAASIERIDGLHKFLAVHPQVQLRQIVNADWQQDKARNMSTILLKRYPDIKLIWAASDMMALGALDSAGQAGLIPGKTVFTGGIDGTDEGLEALARGRLQATLSGHDREGAQALELLHDHFMGCDFAQQRGTRIRTRLQLHEAESVTSPVPSGG
jgi:ABC-type sugar transport system substrate-binding protein